MVRSTSSWSSWSLQTNISHSKRITPSVTHVWDMLFDNMGNVIQLLFCHNARHPWTTKSLLESWPNSIGKDASFVAVCTSVFRAWQMRGSQLPHGCWIQSLHIFHGSNFVLDIPVSMFNTTLLMWVSGLPLTNTVLPPHLTNSACENWFTNSRPLSLWNILGTPKYAKTRSSIFAAT